jgi:hypothetical protein
MGTELPPADALREYRPVPDRPEFRFLKVAAGASLVLGLVAAVVSEIVKHTEDSVKRFADPMFGVCIAVAIVLGLLNIFLSRACPRCGREMARSSPGSFDFVTTYKYICRDCKLYIDTLMGHGRD